jgi:hypothetical protein
MQAAVLQNCINITVSAQFVCKRNLHYVNRIAVARNRCVELLVSHPRRLLLHGGFAETPSNCTKLKLKLKLSHCTPPRRLGERLHSSYSLSTSAPDEVSGQRHFPAAIEPRGKDHRNPLYRRLGGPQSRSGHRG